MPITSFTSRMQITVIEPRNSKKMSAHKFSAEQVSRFIAIVREKIIAQNKLDRAEKNFKNFWEKADFISRCK